MAWGFRNSIPILNVIKDIQVTLYEIFGYLFPGAIVLFALAIGFAGIFWPNECLALDANLSNFEIVLLLFSSYLIGHITQGLANYLEILPAVRKSLKEHSLLSPDLLSLLKTSLSKRYGLANANIPIREIYDLCDQTLLHHSSLGEREIFIYREGFYRGCTVALAVLAIALFPWDIRSSGCVSFHADIIRFSRCQMLPFTFMIIAGAYFTFERYKRFQKLKIKTCLLRFLSLTSELQTKEKNAAHDTTE